MSASGVLLLGLAALLPPAAPQEDGGAPPPAFDEVPLELRVNHAVDRAVEYVFGRQEEGGAWGTYDKVHPTGRTALALLALLHAGVAADEPRVARGVDWLIARLVANHGPRYRNQEPPYRSTYETGITLMLLHDLGTAERFVGEMQPLVEFLVDHFDRGALAWGYPGGTRDLSNSQYAVLGLRAAAHRGVESKASRDVLVQMLRGVFRHQRPDGGFAYRPEQIPRGSMTVAGLAMIQILREQLKSHGAARREIEKCDEAVRRAQEWLEKHFDVARHPSGLGFDPGNLHYYLFGVERYGSLFGVQEIAGRPWYRDGAEHLVAQQKKDGSWGSLEETCFAILFLRRATLTPPAARTRERYDQALAAREPPPEPPRADPGLTSLREWLVAAPFPASAPGIDDAMAADHVGEAKQRPQAGRAAGRKRWEEFVAAQDVVDFKEVVGPGNQVDYVVGYAALWLDSAEPRDVVLWLDSDDGIRAYLDGTQVFESHHHGKLADLRVPLSLPAGASCLMLKLENVDYDWTFRARLSTPEGGPVEDVGTALRPTRR